MSDNKLDKAKDKQDSDIARLYASGILTAKEICDIFHVSLRTIQRALRR